MRGPKPIRSATVLVSSLLFAGALHAFEPSGLLEIHQINVQQGESALIIGPDGTTVLLDAGDNGKGAQIVAYLRTLGLDPEDGLDYTLAGHLDADHVGGFDEVFQAGYDVRLGNWYNGSTKSNATIEDYKASAAGTAIGGPIKAIVGDTVDLGNGALLTVVAGDGEVIGHGIVDGAGENENDLSVAVLVQYGSFDYIWASDLGGGDADSACTGRSTNQVNVETPLARAITPGGFWPLVQAAGVDVLHVNHHGSESSTNSDYMNLLKPAVAVIPVGAGQAGSWHHPRQDVVESVLLAEASCVTAPSALVLQTEEGGPTGSNTSFSGFAVGDIKISTDGVTNYLVEANGAVSQGPDERAAAGLPRSFPLTTVNGGTILLSEVLYDVPGNDDGLEWVELVNNGPQSVDLSGYSLGAGGDDYTYSLVQLSGTLPPCGTFVVGGPSSNGANAFPSFDRVVNFDPDFQNSGTAGDGVALFDRPASAVTAGTVPIDAVIYGPNNNNGLIDETGAPPPPAVGDADPGSSIERFDAAGSWRIRSSPSPNATPLPTSACDCLPCVADTTTLCLGEDRFQVEVAWDTASSQGAGQVVPGGTDDSSNLWFFSPNNWEMLIKVLDGCAINDRFWVFFAATTDVGFTVTVTDTRDCQTKEYSNPLGQAANAVTDSEAFATCP